MSSQLVYKKNIFRNVIKNELLIEDYTTREHFTYAISFFKVVGYLLNSNEWARIEWSTWYKKHPQLKRRKERNLTMFDSLSIMDEVCFIITDNEENDFTNANFVSINSVHKLYIKHMTLKKSLLLEDLIFNNNKGHAMIIKNHYSGNIVCTDMNNGSGYLYNTDTALWEQYHELELCKYANELLEGEIKKRMSDDEYVTKLSKILMQVQTTSYIIGVLKMLRSFIYDKEFEKKLSSNINPNLLPIKHKCVIDLKTKQLTPRTKEHYYTFECPITIGDGSYRHQVEEFFFTIMNKDRDKYHSLQVILGSWLTGETVKSIFIFGGSRGNNGKSSLADIVKNVLGEYYTNVSKGVITYSGMESRDGSAHTANFNQLIGKRIGVQRDSSGSTINPLIKDISGGDDISLRQLHQEFKSHGLPAKLVAFCNNLPKYDTSDMGLVNRVKYISFDAIFSAKPKLGEFKADEPTIKLLQTIGINDVFSWMLDGAVQFYENNKQIPMSIIDTKATEDYRNENDPIKYFLEQYIQKDDNGEITVSDITQEYNQWLKFGNIGNRCTNTNMKEYLKNSGYRVTNSHNIAKIHGFIKKCTENKSSIYDPTTNI